MIACSTAESSADSPKPSRGLSRNRTPWCPRVRGCTWRLGNLKRGNPGARQPSSASVYSTVQPAEELLSCPFGPERVKDHVLPVLRDDLVFALGL
jgi:hypothetical protein